MDLDRSFDPTLGPEEGAAIELAALSTSAVRHPEGPSVTGALLHGRRDSLYGERIFRPEYAHRCVCGRQLEAAARGARCGVELWAAPAWELRWGIQCLALRLILKNFT